MSLLSSLRGDSTVIIRASDYVVCALLNAAKQASPQDLIVPRMPTRFRHAVLLSIAQHHARLA